MILVVAETRGGVLNPASLEAIAAAQQMGDHLVVAVPGSDLHAAVPAVSAFDVAEVIALEHEALAVYTADGFVAALAALAGDLAPAAVVFAHTYQARDCAPALPG